jgi:hypothetical protein
VLCRIFETKEALYMLDHRKSGCARLEINSESSFVHEPSCVAPSAFAPPISHYVADVIVNLDLDREESLPVK